MTYYLIFFLLGSVFGFLLGYLLRSSRKAFSGFFHEALAPLKQDLSYFHQRLEDVFLNTNKEQFALKHEIKRIVEVNQQMTQQTESLSKALRGDLRVQGIWGEVILENLLENAGLRRGDEYIVQGLHMRLKSVEADAAVRPDVLIKLPDDRHIIIDAKVSLTAYERLCQKSEDSQNTEDMRAFIASVKAHIASLGGKNYQSIETLGAPDFIFMFMPIDGAYALAMRTEPTLHTTAWEKGIILVSPATLLAALRTIASLWRGQRQNNNALEIARRGGMLYDKVAQLIEHIEEVGTHLNRLQKSYENVVHKISRERGNVVFQIEQLQEMGAKASRKISKQWHCGQDETD